MKNNSPENSLLDPESVTLRDGTSVIIRPIRPEDAPLLKVGFDRLSTESIYLRFLSSKKVLTDDEAQHAATVDYATRMAFVATYAENDEDIVVAVARYELIDPRDPAVAEAAIIVGDALQSQGLGKLLMARLVAYARSQGISFFQATVQLGNQRILNFVRGSGLPFEKRLVEDAWEITVDLSSIQPGHREK